MLNLKNKKQKNKKTVTREEAKGSFKLLKRYSINFFSQMTGPYHLFSVWYIEVIKMAYE